MERKEYKSFYSPILFDTKDDAPKLISGYFAHFGSVDSDGDIFQKGAFSKTIQENGPKSPKPRIKYLLDHDKKQVAGVLLDLYEDEVGLKYEAELGDWDTGVKVSQMALKGALTEHSVGFNTIKRDKSDKRVITEAKLWEGSILQTWGANSNTPLLYAKGDSEPIDIDWDLLLFNVKRSKDDALIAEYKEKFQEFIQSVTPHEAEQITSKGFNPTKEELKELITQNFTLKNGN